MTSRRVVINVCDWCGKDERELLVETHTLGVDGKFVQFEACEKDWQVILEAFAPAAVNGRKIEQPTKIKRVTQRVEVPAGDTPPAMPFPGTDWRFTSHALERMGQRRLNPIDVLAVADHPQTTYEGDQKNGAMVHRAHGIRVLLDPVRKTILTASAGEDDREQAQA